MADTLDALFAKSATEKDAGLDSIEVAPRGNKSWMKKGVVGYTDLQAFRKTVVLTGKEAKDAFPSRKEVRWSKVEKLGTIETHVVERVLVERGDEHWYEPRGMIRNWTVKVFETGKAGIGHFQIISEEKHVPLVAEYAQIYGAMERVGLNVLYVHDNEGECRNGKPNMSITDEEETLEQAKERYLRGHRDVLMHLPMVIVQKCKEEYPNNPQYAWKKAVRMIKECCAELRDTPFNLWGYGVKVNKGMGACEESRINLAVNKYPVSKAPGSKKRSKGGGGGAFRVGTPSKVDREVMANDVAPEVQERVVVAPAGSRMDKDEFRSTILRLMMNTIGDFGNKAEELHGLEEAYKKLKTVDRAKQAEMDAVIAEASKMYDDLMIEARVEELSNGRAVLKGLDALEQLFT